MILLFLGRAARGVLLPLLCIATPMTALAQPLPAFKIVSQSTVPGYAGLWEGTFQCGAYGGYVLQISETAPGQYSGIASYRPTPANPKLKPGSYGLIGKIVKGGELELAPTDWVVKPAVEIWMLGFRAKLRSDNLMEGKILHDECQMITARRKGPPPLPEKLQLAHLAVVESALEGEYEADTTCAGQRMIASIRVRESDMRFGGSISYTTYDGVREGRFLEANRLEGFAASENEVVLEPDLDAVQKMQVEKGTLTPWPGMVFRRVNGEWEGQNLNPNCAAKPLRRKGADTYVADNGQPLQGLAWIGHSPFELIGGKSFFEHEGLDTNALLNARELAPGMKWAKAEIALSRIALFACEGSDCANNPARRAFFVTNHNSFDSLLRNLPRAVTFVSSVDSGTTQVCRFSTGLGSQWFCVRTKQAFPADLAPDKLFVWSENAMATEETAWRKQYPDEYQPCYEKQLDVRYDMQKISICPPPIRGRPMPSQARW